MSAGNRQRILLAEFHPKVPAQATYATWSAEDKAPSITLSNGNLTATKTTTSATAWGCLRGTIPMKAGQHYWETTHNYTGAADLVAGIEISGFSLTTPPGTIFLSVGSAGGPDKAGDTHLLGAVVANLGVVPSGGVVRHWLDMDGGIYRVANGAGPWSVVGGTSLIYFLNDSGGAYPVAAFLRPIGTTVSMTANFGAP